MTHKILVIFLVLTFTLKCKAQEADQISFEISYNQINLTYKNYVSSFPLWIEPYLGIANQDVNRELDDFTFGVKLGKSIFTFEKSDIYLGINTGLYFPNNCCYDVTTPFAGVFCGYEFLLGKTKKHVLFTEIGYRYGQREYSQTYENSQVFISTTDKFELTPLSFSIGYGFRF